MLDTVAPHELVEERDRKVLRLMAEGQTQESIAEALEVDLSWVKRRVARLHRLFGLPRGEQLKLWLADNGFRP